MVGVSGGSRGCARCRRRKVKCDQARPTCQRCLKAGLASECGGYPDTFLHDPRSFNQDHRKQSRERSRSKTRSPPQMTELSQLYREQPSPDYDMNSMIQQRRRETGDPTGPLSSNNWVPEFLDLLPFSDTICVAYASKNLLKGAASQRNIKYPFTLPGLDHFNKDGVVKNCILAISCTYFGQQYNNAAIAGRGSSLYGTALKDLNTILGDPLRNRTLEVFESIMVMTLYELLVAKKTTGWVTHCLGLEMLFKSYGPGAFNTPSSLGFFENSRSMMITAAMLSMRTTILSEPDWKIVPWSNSPEDKSDLQYLYDIMADLPEITMQYLYTLEPPLVLRPESYMDVNTIYTKSVTVLRALDQWRRRWFNTHYEEIFETLPTYTPSTWFGNSEDLRWKTCWHFASLHVATGYTTYHALLIMTLRAIWNCEASGLLTIDHPNVDRSRALDAAGIEICRCVDFHLLDSESGAGSLFILMPARCAWKVLGEHSAEGQWLLAMMRDVSLGERGRWAIASTTLSNFEPVTASPMPGAIYDVEPVPTSPQEPFTANSLLFDTANAESGSDVSMRSVSSCNRI